MKPGRRASRRAMALIVSLGMLTLLAIVATTFVALSRSERVSSENYVIKVRARMLAESGIDYALAKLRTPLGLGPESVYGGEDLNGNGAQVGGPFNADALLDDANGNAGGAVDFLACPLRFARRPSWFADANGDGLPDLLDIVERGVAARRGYSGVLPGTLHALGDTFAIRLLDTSSELYVNGAGNGYRALYRNLCLLLLGNASLGDRIQARQPYGTPEDLVVTAALTEAEFAVLRPYLTCQAWVDSSTMRPDPQASLLVMPRAFRRLDRVEPRAPINVNGADFNLLVAVFQGISGFFTDNNAPVKSFFSINATRARALAQAIVDARAETFVDANPNGVWDPGEAFVDRNANGRYDGPFRTWDQFENFLGGVQGFVGNFNRAFRELVLANANPNSCLNKFQPDAHRYHGTDKADLVVYTTELCFSATGFFDISSYGRVTDSSNRVVGEDEVRAVVKLFETRVLTTQEDFESAGVKVTMDPDVRTLPEEVSDFATESFTDTNGDGRFTKGDAFQDANGDGARDGPAIYDGQVTLRPADPPGSLPWGDASALTFRALFNDSAATSRVGRGDAYPSLVADVATPANRRFPLSSGATVSNVVRGASLVKDLSGSNNYSDLFPDGLFIRRERQKTIYYSPIGNIPPLTGSVGFWVKPTWRGIPAALQYRDLLGMDQQFAFAPNRGRIFLMYALTPGVFVLEALWNHDSAGTAANEVDNDQGYVPPIFQCLHTLDIRSNNWNPGQWHYFALRWQDMMRFNFFLDGNSSASLFEAALEPGVTIIRIGPVPTLNLFTLGSNMPWFNTIGSGTFDDLRVHRSLVPNSDVGLAPPWRYDDTGYPGYSTYVGRFTLPQGAVVRTLGMTSLRPSENYRGDPLDNRVSTPRRRRPDVSLSYKVSSETGWRVHPRSTDPNRVDGEELPVDPNTPAVGAGETFQFMLTFDRRGQDPFRNSPTVDDVRVTYALGSPQFLSYNVVP
ncbi:MAG: hypothetical protein HYZ53_28905 [Planctomycetes bacterium]|nr:hypothetical protein [Planctomycetota bacterium]